jgi:hypothetical protein
VTIITEAFGVGGVMTSAVGVLAAGGVGLGALSDVGTGDDCVLPETTCLPQDITMTATGMRSVTQKLE